MSAVDASSVTLDGGLRVVGPWKRGGHLARLPCRVFHAEDKKESRVVLKKIFTGRKGNASEYARDDCPCR